MNVYVVMSGVPYAGEQLEGIFSTEELAIAHAKDIAERHGSEYKEEKHKFICFYLENPQRDYIIVIKYEIDS